MKRAFILILLAHLSIPMHAQDTKRNQLVNEELLKIDTVQIAPNIQKMVFKYYRSDDQYTFKDAKEFGRFEVYRLGESAPFCRDTVEDIRDISYEDANFDGILDIRIVTLVGMSGDNNSTCYYLYTPREQTFEFGIGGLSNPTPNKSDSTIYSSGSCCMGTGGSSQAFRLVNGQFTLIRESSSSRESSWEKTLVGDSLIVTTLSTSTLVEGATGREVFIDSTLQYLFGKLRIIAIYTKVGVHPAQKGISKEEGQFSEDVMGAFVYKTEELFQYSKTANGRITCTYTLSKARKDQLVIARKKQFQVKD